MNTYVVLSAVILLLMSVGSNAFYMRRQLSRYPATGRSSNVRTAGQPANPMRPTVIYVQGTGRAPAEPAVPAAPAAPLAPVAPAAPAVSTATATAPASTSRMTVQDLNKMRRDMYIADMMDVPYIPPGVDPMTYQVSQKLDIPYIPYSRSGNQGVDYLQSMVIANALDHPAYF